MVGSRQEIDAAMHAIVCQNIGIRFLVASFLRSVLVALFRVGRVPATTFILRTEGYIYAIDTKNSQIKRGGTTAATIVLLVALLGDFWVFNNRTEEPKVLYANVVKEVHA